MSGTTPSRAKLFNALFRDRQGNVVIGQWPNLPIIIALVAWLAQLFVAAQPYHVVASIVFYVALVVWAVLEIGWGVNYFRRGLGLVVLVVVALSLFRVFY